MSNQITGRLAAIGQTETITGKNGKTFQKRSFLLDARTFDPYTGQPSEYENMLPLELTAERCADLDRFRTDDTVTVSFALQGRMWQGTDGKVHRLTAVRCYRIEPYGKNPATQQPAPQPAAIPPAPFPPQVDASGNPQKDDLPF